MIQQAKRWIIIAVAGLGLVLLSIWQVNEHVADLEGVTDIGSISQLEDTFNADVGTPRLILLLSPT